MTTTCEAPPLLSPALTEQIDRLVASEQIRGSDALCRILRYLGEHASDASDTSVKEYVLATRVLGRHPDQYDSSFDSCVRVQVMRLRTKLAQYYAGAGALDPILITIPRGAYKLIVTERSVVATAPDPPPIPEEEPVVAITSAKAGSWAFGLVGAVCLVLGVLLGIALTLSAGAIGTLAR
jgi:hypothetical protein